MKGVIDLAFSHARTVISTLVLLLIAGTVSYVEIAKEAEPDVNIPLVIVRVIHEGISPEDSERLIIRPLEQELSSVEGMKEMRAKGFEGGASVILEFDAGFDVDKALRDVREQVDLAKSKLPDDSDDPVIEEINISAFPIVTITLSGDVPERALLHIGREMRDAIEGISSVLAADLTGVREEMVEILIDPVKMESYSIDPGQATAVMKNSNKLVAAGAQDTGRGRFVLKVPGLFDTIDEIMSIPVSVNGDSVVKLADIAEVRRSFKDPKTFARVGGNRAVTLDVSKRAGENLIQTVENVRAVAEEERANWSPVLQNAVTVSFINDKSTIIKERLSSLENSVISAVILVMIVVVAALGLRSATLVGIAIPGSFLTGVMALYAMGLTMNMVVLFGLVLAVGMLVDGAIVVTEYADRKMTEGEPRHRAYSQAAKLMAAPIVASTLTTLAAFLPLLFWPGIVGEFMVYLPITLIATLSASLLMALVFVPTLGAHMGRAGTADPGAMRALAGDEADFSHVGKYTGQYLKILEWALDRPGKILLMALVMLVGVQIVYGAFGKGVEFFPETEPELAKLDIRARGNLSMWERDALLRSVETEVLKVEGIDTVYAITRSKPAGEAAEDVIGNIFLEFADWDKRRPAEQILAEIKNKTSIIAGIIIASEKAKNGPPTGKAIQLQLSSRFPELLAPTAGVIVDAMEGIGGFINMEDSRPLPGIDWEFEVDRAQAAKFGANISSIGSAVRMATGGVKLGGYRPDDTDEELDIRARFPEEYRTLEQIRHIRVQSNNGRVPISNFVEIAAKPKVGTISRTDSRRVIVIKAGVEDGILANDKIKEISAWLKTANLDPRVKITFKGEDEEQKKASEFLSKAFGVALFLIAIILVTQFNSFYSGALILSAVIMSTVGVFIGLLITGQPFGIVMGGIGVISLAGIVVNNNIVLIDTFDRLKETIPDIRQAIMLTGAQRMRPVLLTTVTTVLGLIPMALNMGIDFVNRSVEFGTPSNQMWVQLSTSIVFGLTFSTLLTLVLTPAALMARVNFTNWWKQRRATRIESPAE
ncbi:MAG: efflux RND transporter permease subunit [Rhodospirillaceae bacterium]|nr:efflux RND transporter permease subunit [Rhodospirillaceae bacterium]